VASIPILGPGLRNASSSFARRQPFSGSNNYWERRYSRGGNSGTGSHGRLAAAKADVLNRLVEEEGITSVLELGCGDGNQLDLAKYPSYVGVDVSTRAIEVCRERFAHDQSKRFFVTGTEPLPDCELGLSLDVIYHLVEDDIFESYMDDLLSHSSRRLVLYTSDSDAFSPRGDPPPHIRHRPVSKWVASHPDWHMTRRIANPFPFQEFDQDNTSFADFYIFERDPGSLVSR